MICSQQPLPSPSLSLLTGQQKKRLFGPQALYLQVSTGIQRQNGARESTHNKQQKLANAHRTQAQQHRTAGSAVVAVALFVQARAEQAKLPRRREHSQQTHNRFVANGGCCRCCRCAVAVVVSRLLLLPRSGGDAASGNHTASF